MIQLRDKDTGEVLGNITDAQLQFMVDHLEEESRDDRDYYINEATLVVFEEEGADPELVALLRRALGTREEMEVCWSRS